MISDKYYKFFVNNEEFIFEKKKLMKYEFFKILFQDKFKIETTVINFDIDNKQVDIAHNLNLNKLLNIHQIIQINNYLNFLTPINYNNILIKLERLYKPTNTDFVIIKEIIDSNLKKRLITKLIKNLTFEHIDKNKIIGSNEYIIYLQSILSKFDIVKNDLKFDRDIHSMGGGYYGCDGKPYLFVDNKCLFSYWDLDEFDNNLKQYIIDNLLNYI